MIEVFAGLSLGIIAASYVAFWLYEERKFVLVTESDKVRGRFRYYSRRPPSRYVQTVFVMENWRILWILVQFFWDSNNPAIEANHEFEIKFI